MTSYEKIFKSFLRKVSDAELANRIEFNTELAIEDMTGYLHSAVAKYNVDDKKITFDDDNQVIEEDLSDWEIEMYALGMRIEWLEPLVQARMNISQMFGGKEEKLTLATCNYANRVRCIQKCCSVSVRICWKPLRGIIPKQRDEIRLCVMV